MTNKPYVGDVLTPQDILDHERTLLVAGVGSGKNTFFEERFPDKRILIATSMAAKVNETQVRIARKGINNVACITISKLAAMWQNWCNGEREMTPHLEGNRIVSRVFNYDIIVIDEAHALVVDASFANDRVMVLDFLQYGVRNQNVVLCTATPEPLLSSHCLAGFDYRVIDLLDTCRNLRPQKVIITSQDDFLKEMETEDGNIRDFSYLANARRTTTELSSYLYDKYGKEGIRTYNADDRFNEEDPTDYLISTSCSREGLNVHNQEPSIVAVETHDPLLAYQFAGRFRNGVAALYILYDVNSKKQIPDNSNLNSLAMNLAALPTDSVQLGNDSLLEVTGGYAYRSPYSDDVLYNKYRKFSILRSNQIKDSFKEDPVGLFSKYFENIEYREEICLKTSSEGRKLLKANSMKNYAKFEKYLDELYFKNRSEDGVWYASAEEMDKVLEESKRMNIKRVGKDVEYTDPYYLVKDFGYERERGSTNNQRRKYHSLKLIKLKNIYYNLESDGVVMVI